MGCAGTVGDAVFTGPGAVPAYPSAVDADDQLAYGDVVTAGDHGRLACLPRTHLFNGTHVTHYTHFVRR